MIAPAAPAMAARRRKHSGRLARLALGLAAGIGLCSMAAAQTAACWDDADLSAARVLEMKALMTGGSMRCHLIGIDTEADLAMFIQANHAALQAAFDRLEAHFATPEPEEGRRAFDTYSTHIFNLFGGGRTTPATCAAISTISRSAIDKAADADALPALAAQIIRQPHLTEPKCGGPVLAVAVPGTTLP